MKPILPEIHPHKLIQTSVDRADNRLVESVMSLANGYMGARGNYEEYYSGTMLKGTYIAGVWVPDKTRVGWWKNGYPRYYGKVINAPDFLSVDVYLNGSRLDLATADILTFYREIDMFTGIMTREMRVNTSWGEVLIRSERFFSRRSKEICCTRYTLESTGFAGEAEIRCGIDANVFNTDANYGEQFWQVEKAEAKEGLCLVAKTHENPFEIERFAVAIQSAITAVGKDCRLTQRSEERAAWNTYTTSLAGGDAVTLERFTSVVTSRDYAPEALEQAGREKLRAAASAGYARMAEETKEEWTKIWQQSDIVIEGDDAAQQGIRFSLFNLRNTYDGSDARLNVGPKGFTGEKYGGAAYYDTEGYCIPMYLATSPPQTARNLLLFRYNTLEAARENAAKIGMRGALYPMVTFNGEECHNEWEITFEEIHRNAAMVYAIYTYTNYTGDESYIQDYGIHVMMEVARFWVSRTSYNPFKDKYMLLGVTPPNEYDNNVNNSWLTNYMAQWCIEYALENADKFGYALDAEERKAMETVAAKMYLGYDGERGIFISQDDFFDKDLKPVSALSPQDLPLCQNWSWDRILRSPYIKQADVVLGLFYFPNRFTQEEKKRNFEFYEPFTVHESSLSPSIYSIVASQYGNADKAYELYQRTARLDLDNRNNDTGDGLHITSMGGSWQTVVHGFAGLSYHTGQLCFAPRCPAGWQRVTFRIYYRGSLLEVAFDTAQMTVCLLDGPAVEVAIEDAAYLVEDKVSVVLRAE